MTAEDRIKAIAEFGFTERQARFLVLVMRHAGVCVPRQYATFAAIANGGEKCNALFEKLIRRGYAVACGCVHNRARLYHVHHKPLSRTAGAFVATLPTGIDPSGRAVLLYLDVADAVLRAANDAPRFCVRAHKKRKSVTCFVFNIRGWCGSHPLRQHKSFIINSLY
jgi:hypothetical protein